MKVTHQSPPLRFIPYVRLVCSFYCCLYTLRTTAGRLSIPCVFLLLCPVAISTSGAAPLPNHQENTQLIALGRNDFDASLAFIDSNYPSDQRLSARYLLLVTLCQERLDLIPKIPKLLAPTPGTGDSSLFNVNSALQGITTAWVKKDPTAIISYAQSTPRGPLKDQLVFNLVVSLTSSGKFADAKPLLETIDLSSAPLQTFTDIAAACQEKDEDALLSWTASLPPRLARQIFISFSGRYVYTKDLTRLLKLAKHAPGEVESLVLEQLGKLSGEQEGHNLLTWLESLEFSTTQKTWILVGALRSAPKDKLEQILETILASGGPQERKAATRAYVNHVFSLNRDQASEWVLNSPMDLRSTALLILVGRWCEKDPKASLEWIKGLKKGVDRDIALRTYSETLSKNDAATANDVAKEIDDPVIRSDTLSRLPKR